MGINSICRKVATCKHHSLRVQGPLNGRFKDNTEMEVHWNSHLGFFSWNPHLGFLELVKVSIYPNLNQTLKHQ